MSFKNKVYLIIPRLVSRLFFWIYHFWDAGLR